MIRNITAFLTFTALSYAGDTRSWTSADGSKQFQAEFISSQEDAITLLREDGKEITFEISKLHKDDLVWLDEKNSAKNRGKNGGKQKENSAEYIFDTLAFGDDRQTVSLKLKESTILETESEGIFQGSTGINGVYRIKTKIGGHYCYLSFDWTPAGALKEITLYTKAQPKSAYDTSLKNCWTELVEVVDIIHGLPKYSGQMVSSDILKENQILGSHLWKIDEGGSVMLGTSKTDKKYKVMVRFTTEDLLPKE